MKKGVMITLILGIFLISFVNAASPSELYGQNSTGGVNILRTTDDNILMTDLNLLNITAGSVVVSQNVTIGGWFNGLFNWIPATNWNIFDGHTLTFNETKLNETISIEGVALGFNSSFNSTYDNLNSSRWESDGENISYSGGNVGIGTDSPGGNLEITGDGPSIRFTDDIGTTAALRFLPLNGINYIQSGDVYSGGSTADLRFTDMFASNTWMTIKDGGNVGIGTTNPTHTLNVDGTFNVTGQSIMGDIDINGNWADGGASFIGGDLFVQTLYAYNLTAIGVDSFRINGSLYPQDGFDDTFEIGNETRRWKSISIGTGDSSFAGDVGIGTDTPLHDLQIGDGTTAPSLALKGSTSSLDASIMFEAQDGSDRWTIAGDFSGTLNNDLLRFSDFNNPDILVLKGDGNVGIGTSIPSFSAGGGLEIEKSTGAVLRLQSSTSIFEARAETNEVTLSTQNTIPLIFGTGATEAMRIDGAGDVLVLNNFAVGASGDGIIHVESSTPDLRLISTVINTNSRVVFGDSAGDFRGWIDYDHTNDLLGFATNGVGSNDMVIDSNGDVGIGTDSPDNQLEVSNTVGTGSIKLTGQNGNVVINQNQELDFIYTRTSAGTANMDFQAMPVSPGAATYRFGLQSGSTGPNTITLFDPNGVNVFAQIGTGGVIFNQIGRDVDFRVEGLGEVNALFVQGSDGNVGIGIGSPARMLHINDTMRLEPRGTVPSSANIGDIYVDNTSGDALCIFLDGGWNKIAGTGTCA